MNLCMFELNLVELYKQAHQRRDLEVSELLLQALEAHSKTYPGTSNVLAQAYLTGIEPKNSEH